MQKKLSWFPKAVLFTGLLAAAVSFRNYSQWETEIQRSGLRDLAYLPLQTGQSGGAMIKKTADRKEYHNQENDTFPKLQLQAETSPLAPLGAHFKGIVLLPASIDKFGLSAALGSSLLFKMHSWYPVLVVNEESYRNTHVPLLDEWIKEHSLCIVPIKYPEPLKEDPSDGMTSQTFLRYKRLVLAPYIAEYMERECSIDIGGVRNNTTSSGAASSTLIVMGDGDLWPINDLPLQALKTALDLSEDPKTSIALQGTEVKGFPWRRRALCYTGATVAGWRKYMNASGDLYSDWNHHVEKGRELRQVLRAKQEGWEVKTPLFHMDEYILGYKLFVEKSHPVVETSYWPRRAGKHMNQTWFYNETAVYPPLFAFDDVHLGRSLKPKPLMDSMLNLVLSKQGIDKYWAIVSNAPSKPRQGQ